jgi:hypothetical protein
MNEWLKSKSTLRLTVIQSVSLVSSPIWGSWPDIYYSLTVTVLFLWGALSDDRTVLSFICSAGSCQRSLPRVRFPWDSCLRFETSQFIASYDSQGHVGGILPRLHTGGIEFTSELSFIIYGELNRGPPHRTGLVCSVASVAAETRASELLLSKWTSACVDIPYPWKALLNLRWHENVLTEPTLFIVGGNMCYRVTLIIYLNSLFFANNSSKASYKVSKSKDGMEQVHTKTQQQQQQP